MAELFCFRMRAYAAAHFDWDDVLTVTWPDAEAKFQSEYTGGDDGRAYPVTIHGEIRGPAESIEDAEPRLSRMIGNTLPLISLAANAAIADPLALATYGLDLTRPQPFVGYRTPHASEWFPPGKRRIDVEATHALMRAVGHSPQTDLFHRAAESYRRALGHWTPETRLLAGEYLFITSETLSRFMIESRAASQGMTPKNLARLNRAANPDALRATYLCDEIFRGDADALEAMEEASNGFEHGYKGVDDVRGLLEPVLERSMRHVRRALIASAGVETNLERRLLSDDHAEPRGLVPDVHFVRGELTRRDPNQPAPAMEWGAVEIDWRRSAPMATRSASGDVNISLPQNIRVANLPPNTILNLHQPGMRAAHVRLVEDEPLRVEVRRAGEMESRPNFNT